MTTMTDHLFASALREDRWTFRGGQATHNQSHLESGWSLTRLGREQELLLTTGTDFASLDADRFLDRSPGRLSRDLHERLGAIDPPVAAELSAAVDIRVRSTARYVSRGESPVESHQTIVIARVSGRSIVTTPEALTARLSQVLEDEEIGEQRVSLRDSYPTLWLEGSGAVLFHELIGHPSEASAPALSLPSWLEVMDDPGHEGLGSFSADDTGLPSRVALLSSGNRPAGFRRDNFRNPPLRRMSNLVVRHQQAPFSLPDSRVEIREVAGASWDELIDSVSLTITNADLVTPGRRQPLDTFRFHASRKDMAAAMAGARGSPVSYPGVICSREGQKVPVGSWAPDLLMGALPMSSSH